MFISVVIIPVGPKMSLKTTEQTKNGFIHKKKLRGFSPQANYADRAIAAGRRS
jgi:hypothetical protein